MKNTQKYTKIHKNTLSWLLIFLLFCSPTPFFVRNALQISIVIPDATGLISYISWLLLVLVAAMSKRVRRNYMFFLFVIMGNEVIALFTGNSVFGINPLLHINSPLLFATGIIVTLGVNWSSSLTKSDVDRVMRAMFIIGIIACVYAMIFQGDVLLSLMRGNYVGHCYTSFLSHRNVFGSLCYLSIICTFFLWLDKKKIIYLIGIVIIFLHIAITDSRNPFFSTILFFWLYFVFRNKISIKLIIAGTILLSMLFAFLGLSFGDIAHLFAHKTGQGLETEQRFLIWQVGFEKIYEHGAFISGFSTEARKQFLYALPYFRQGNFHNVYVDALFDGGIIKLSVYIWAVAIAWKNICKHSNVIFRNITKAGLLSYSFYCAFESGQMLFTANYFAIIATVLFVILPWYREES